MNAPYETLTADELRYAILQRDEQLRMALDENKRLKHEHVTDMVKAGLERDQLRQQLAQARAACVKHEEYILKGFVGMGWLSPDEARRLEAERDEAKGAFVLQKHLMKKLEAAGQDLLGRLAKAEAQLKEAVDLLTRADPGKADSWPVSWSNRRDAFLAEQKEL